MSDGRFAKAAEARKYHSLDGLRGVAAIAVVSIHYDGYLKPLILPSAHLAVDMFFLMSGFVIGHAYSEKLSSRMSPMTFIIARLIRLYPMYILGTLIAVLPISAAILLGADLVWTWKTLSLATVAAVTMIPGPPIPNKLPALYVLNFPAWSLFFEVVSNVLYALAFPILRGRAIYLVIAVGGIGIAIASFLYGDVGGGWLWSDAWVGFFRVIFSFFLGILLHRMDRAGVLYRPRFPAWLIIAACFAVFTLQPSQPYRPIYELLCIYLFFPALVIAALSNEPRRGVPVFTFLGVISYPLYAIHIPIRFVIDGVASKVVGRDPTQFAPMTGIFLTVVLVGASWLLAKTYDVWARRLLTRLASVSYFRRARGSGVG